MPIPTVRVKSTHPASQGEFVVINESDLTNEHEFWEEPAAEAPAPVAPPLAPEPARVDDKDGKRGRSAFQRP